MIREFSQRPLLRRWWLLVGVWLLVMMVIFVAYAQIANSSGPIVVNSTIDRLGNDGSCTLREAVIAANKDKSSGSKDGECQAGSGADTIAFTLEPNPSGPDLFILTRTDKGKEDSHSTGDLDITDDLMILGDGPGATVITGDGITNRLFHVLGGQVTLSGLTIQNGNVIGDGGAIYNSAILTVTNTVIRNNDATQSGGAIYNDILGTLVITQSTITGNVAAGSGGGISNAGVDVTIEASTMIGNQANQDGGAISNSNGMVLTNTTLISNTAGLNGGAIYNSGSNLTINASTVSDSQADLGGGISNLGEVQISNSIFANSIDGSDCDGPVKALGHNIDSDGSCGFTTSGDPMLGPLQDNGGPTLTRALLDGSPAVEPDSEGQNCPAADQRGVIRPQGLACDIGAFELEDPPQRGPVLIVNTAADVDDGVCSYLDEATNKNCSLREAINRSNLLAGTTTIHFAIDETTITLSSALPLIADAIIIDGATQASGSITLSPDSGASIADGLTINADGSSVTGMHFLNFDANGIVLFGNNNSIIGNETAHNGGDGINVPAGSGNIITNNDIHDNGGQSASPAEGSGIALSGIGGNTVSGNTITFNSGNGVTIYEGTGNILSENDIHHNGGLSVDLGGEGRTLNDQDDPDDGANTLQNHPVLLKAIPETDSITIEGRLNSTHNTTFTIEFFSSPTCNLFGGGTQTFLSSIEVSTDVEGGNVYFTAYDLPYNSLDSFINATATGPGGNTSEYSECLSVGAANISWPAALSLTVVPNGDPVEINQFVDMPGQSRWYRFQVEPGAKVLATLTGLPDNYDLTIYKDIGAAFAQLSQPTDLVQLSAEFAPEAFSPEAFSPEAFSPEAFSPEAFSPEAFSPEAFSPEAFSPEAFSPEAFSPEAFSPEAFSPEAFSPEAFSPEAFSPEAFSPEAFSPEAFSPEAFSSAQSRSLIGVSAFPGTSGEGLIVNTWNNTGDFYVRVRSANGAFSQQQSFHLEVSEISGSCDAVEPLPPASIPPVAGSGRKTLILTDFSRMTDTLALEEKLGTFADLAEIEGVIVDLGADQRVASANLQADANRGCPFAKNVVASAIKDVVNSYWASNPLEYIVIVGDDSVVPFFRYPDNALLANENNYIPPVLDSSPSQASLRFGMVLGQDAYGANTELSFKNSTLPIPNLAVGRLVESAADAMAVLDAYMLTDNGVVSPEAPLVTGYDFLEDVATEIKAQLEAGTNVISATALIADRDLAPTDPAAWTADDLRDVLLGSRHDLMFLAGHFSASGALAADYSTRLVAKELANSEVNLQNAIIFSAGCHAGYNIVDADGVPQVTEDPDWAEAFASKGATLIAGTGYQYGDTDFIEYSERLYLEFTRQLRTGTGPVSIGQAMVAAKQVYLANTAQMRGIHEKSLLEATIFGLPMISVDMPGRLIPEPDISIIGSTTPFSTAPGSSLTLAYADLTIHPVFTETVLSLTNVDNPTQTVSSFYLSGRDGFVSNPAEPVLPLEIANVSVPDSVLRGVGFVSGTYSDRLLGDTVPLTGAPTTEIRGVHGPFETNYFYPVQIWRANYFDLLSNPVSGTTRLALMPAQLKSNAVISPTEIISATMRTYDEVDLRLYYSGNIDAFAGNSIPALAGSPAIASVQADINNDQSVSFNIDVAGNPAAGIQEVWVTYTALNGTPHGKWQSLYLTQSTISSARWQGTLSVQQLGGADPTDVRYFVQAVNGVGLVSLAANLGSYYIPGSTGLDQQPTSLALDIPESSGPYGTKASFSAILSDTNGLIAGQPVVFGLGPQVREAITDQNGMAAATLTLLGLPGQYDVRASFAGTPELEASATAGQFTIEKADTTLFLEQPASDFADSNRILTATLTVSNTMQPLNEKSVFFVLTGNEASMTRAVITDYAGRAVLGNVDLLPAGTYSVAVYFSGNVALHTGETLSLEDARFNSTSDTGSVELLRHNDVPDCSKAAGSEDVIWPLDKSFTMVNIVGVTDADGDLLAITIDDIFQDERVGNNTNSPDGQGIGSDTAGVRAERDGNGDGRVYHIYFTADDGQGGSCTGEVLIPTVPHDQSGDVSAIDGGPLFDSTKKG